MTNPDDPLLAALRRLRGDIDQAAAAAGRSGERVQMLLATKTVPAQRIAVALQAGYLLIGENRVQEVTAKAPELQRLSPTTHLIGHLQSNKVNQVLRWISCLQSLDSVELAGRLDRAAAAAGRTLDVMLQVNVSAESTKFGVPPEAAPALLDRVRGCPALRVVGLMTIGLRSTDAGAVRAGYRRLRELRDAYLPGGELSMGMSGDFADAIAEGATIVRIGSAAFGARAG